MERYDAAIEREYLEANQTQIQEALSTAFSQIISERAPNPLRRLACIFTQLADQNPTEEERAPPVSMPSGPARPMPAPLQADSSSGDWSLGSWLQGLGTHSVAAAAIAKKAGSDDNADTLEFLRGLTSRDEVAQLLRTDAAIETHIDVVWDGVGMLQHTATSLQEIRDKFADAFEVRYEGLDAYHRGLGAVIGSVTTPNLLQAMTDEHENRLESDTAFTMYTGVCTTSKTEWLFVTADDEAAALAQLRLESWPAESEEMADRSHCRERRSLADLVRAAEHHNGQLREMGEPLLLQVEVIAVNMYSGPMFVKYNAVLRGPTSEVPFLKNTFISLCCPKSVADAYLGTARAFQQPSDGAISFDEAKRSANTYTTTIHCINSAVLKLGKLTMGKMAYRGMSDMKLSDQFWIPNEYGFRGGVEAAFISMTEDRATAWFYGRGMRPGSRPGIVVEIQQDMINRGAELSALSQYPHETGLLFNPLSALEVTGTRVEGSVVVVTTKLFVNMKAAPLETILGARFSTMKEMATSKALLVRHELERRDAEYEEAQKQVLADMVKYVESNDPHWYNDNASYANAQAHLEEICAAALSDEKLVSSKQEEAMRDALAEGSLTKAAGKPCELISGQPKSAAMGLYHFMRVKDPFAEEGTAKLENEIAQFIAKLKEQAAKVKQHKVLVTLLEKVGPEGKQLIEDITGDVREALEDIEYFKKISWLPKEATPSEVVEQVEKELLTNLHYILYEETSEVYVKGPDAVRDKGRGKQRFGDFMSHPNVKDAELTASHVASLRLYTTLAYKYINSPLRSQDAYYNHHKPHPLPVTVALIAEGIKKLRAAYAVKVGQKDVVPATALWRGMKNLTMGESFVEKDENGKCKGGTELAPMSTTTDIAVAARYARSGDSLLFKISLDNFMQYGAEVQWLSAFPNEEEVLYPPLTYLQPTGKPPQTLQLPSGDKFTVYEVKPTLP